MEHGLWVGLLINLAIPLAGLVAYTWLWKRMDVEDPNPVVVFLLFAHYGGWLVVILTIFFWYWSGLATLGLWYLATIGTIVTLILTVITFKERRRGKYHLAVFLAY